MNRWVLLIGPHESPTNEWELRQFATEKEAHEEAMKCDLTKEHYILSVFEIVRLIREAERVSVMTQLTVSGEIKAGQVVSASSREHKLEAYKGDSWRATPIGVAKHDMHEGDKVEFDSMTDTDDITLKVGK